MAPKSRYRIKVKVMSGIGTYCTVQYCTVKVFAELLFMEGIKWPFPHGFSELLQVSTRGPYDRTKVAL